MMSSCMTKLEFLLAPYRLFRLGKLPDICCLSCIEFSEALLTLYDMFVMLLKSRSRTQHPHMHYSHIGVGAKTCFPSRSIQKCFTPTLGGNTQKILLLHWEKTPKTCLIGFPPNKWSKFLSLSLKNFVAEKRHGAMQKLFIKEKKLRKNGHKSVRDI